MELNELRKVAEAPGVRPGPWHVYDRGIGYEVHDENDYELTGGMRETFDKADAEFIASFDPPTVLALLSRLEQAERNADTYQKLYEQRAESLEQAEQAVARVREVHRPVDVEPSETICHACSTVRGNGESLRYFPYKEWPCETIRALDGDNRG